jgi:hypothetical protein
LTKPSVAGERTTGPGEPVLHKRSGPSLYSICRTTLQGWKRYKSDPDPRVRERFEPEIRSIKTP